jgi:energy-coupling factor transporter transmembrane protein EcfT
MLTKNKSFIALLISTSLCFLVGANISNIVDDEFKRYSYQSNFETLLIVFLTYLALNLLLLFFSEKIFKLWLRKIVSWFLPVSLFLIWAGGGGNSYTTPDKTTYAIVLGFVLVVVTLGFALVQKFYYKR